MLNTATLAWEAWDANVSRTGAAMHMVAAKMLLVGGTEGSEHSSEAMQFNIGNFMIEFDGVDDEIMIPHLPTIIPNAYTIEAWIRPAKAEAMSVIVRTNETYPQAAWSHQLRINDRGAWGALALARPIRGVKQTSRALPLCKSYSHVLVIPHPRARDPVS